MDITTAAILHLRMAAVVMSAHTCHADSDHSDLDSTVKGVRRESVGLAPALDRDMVARHAMGNQIVTYRLGPAVAELLIVSRIARLISVTCYHHIRTIGDHLLSEVVKLGILLYHISVDGERHTTSGVVAPWRVASADTVSPAAEACANVCGTAFTEVAADADDNSTLSVSGRL